MNPEPETRNPELKILLIEDNPGDARLVHETLKEAQGNFTISVAEKLGLGLKLLLSQDVDVVLLDLNLPDSHGLETITGLQTRFPRLPIVIMTSIDDEELAHQAVRLGAQDYLVKGNVNGELLRRTLIYAIERKQAEVELRKAHDELELRVQGRTKELAEAEKALREINLTLEQRVAERTAELQAANTSLRDSRRAALNLMEDALAARRQAEEASVELRREGAERKKAEEDILKLSEDMAARNVELEAVNRELESFIYSVSHDLRAPLRSMAGFARIVVEDFGDRLDDQGRDYLARIHRGSEKMTRLIDDLLHLSRISRQEVERTEVDLSKQASSIVAELREANPGRSAEVEIQEGLTVFADHRLMEIILSNLMENSWKFTSKTENARIELGAFECGPSTGSGRQAQGDKLAGCHGELVEPGKTVYYVKDNGVGFDPEYKEKMFWPFHRLHSDDEFEGTGIGLTIVERLIHRHGGRVWAEGEQGKGATIYFTIG